MGALGSGELRQHPEHDTGIAVKGTVALYAGLLSPHGTSLYIAHFSYLILACTSLSCMPSAHKDEFVQRIQNQCPLGIYRMYLELYNKQNSSVPTKQDSGDSDGNRILQVQKQKLLQDSGAPDYHFY